MTDIFLSYSREDQATARRFAEALQREGLTVWWDQSLRSGENYDQVTETALREAKAVVVLWSKQSVDSRWVRAEATTADRRGTLMPAMIEPCERPIMFELKHTANLAHWKGDEKDPVWCAFIDDVRQFTGREAPGAAVPGTAPRVTAPAGIPARSQVRIVLPALAVLALLVAAGWWALTREGAKASPPPAETANAPIGLAVVPFTNLSPDVEQDGLAYGLAEDLATQLNQVKTLRVRGPEVTSQFQTGDEDPRAIASALEVGNVLKGTVRRDDQQWRVTVQLLDGKDGARRWSKAYEIERGGISALQQDLVQDVAQAVGVVLGGDYPPLLGGTTNIEAFELFMRARKAWRAGRWDEQLPFLRTAVRLDPEYKRAWMTLNLVLRADISEAPAESVAALRQERQVAARQLESLPPDAPVALRLKAVSLLEQRKWAEAIAAAESAVAKAPARDFENNYMLGLNLLTVGRASDAVAYLRNAVEVEPFHEEPVSVLCATLMALGRPEEAEQAATQARERGVRVPPLQFPQPVPATISEAQRNALVRPDGTLTWPFEGERKAILEDPRAMRAALRRTFEQARGHGFTEQTPGQMRALSGAASGLGDFEMLGTLVRQVLDTRPEATRNIVSTFWLSLRSRNSPEITALFRDLGLVDYWRTSGKWGDFCKPVGETDFKCN